MNRQVLSTEKMQHLKDLGLSLKRTLLYWSRTKNPADSGVWVLYTGTVLATGENVEIIPAYTLQDILDTLPKVIFKEKVEYWLEVAMVSKVRWYVSYREEYGENNLKFISDLELLEAAYKLLCWCIENKYV